MPSGAKKRKAARKKMEKEAHSINNGSHSSSQGSDDPRSRDSDVVDVEREGKFEGSVVNDQGAGNVAEEVKQQKEGFDDVDVRVDDNSREFTSVASKFSSSSSSTSSSSDDDEVTVEKDEPEEVVTPDDSVVASIENLVVDDYVEESIPLEESVKEVVSLPEESATVSESVVPVDQSLTSDVIESGLKEFVDEVLRPSDEKSEVVSAVIDLAQTKIEEKVSPAGDGEGSENTSESVGVVVRDTEVLLPQSSGVKDVDNGKMPETHKYAEEEPLISPAPLPVQRTSVFSCCGLFEAFSGGSR